MTPINQTIKDCPKCHGKCECVYESEDVLGYTVYCVKCGLEQGEVFDTQDEAIEDWNDRTSITLLAGEEIKRGQPVYIKDDLVYVYRPDDDVVDCEHHEEEMQQFPNGPDYDCSWMEIECPLDLPNRKYCREYVVKKCIRKE